MEFDLIFTYIISALVRIIEILGVAVAVWGAFKATYLFIKAELFTKNLEKEHAIENVRLKFGQKILISIEFFVASDLLRVIISPSWEALGKLGAFVVIRTILSYFLTREVRQIKDNRRLKKDVAL